jgi:hypothetical protein
MFVAFVRHAPRRIIAILVKALTRNAESTIRQAARLICGARGHDILICRRPDRVSLRCASCGYESRGWMIGQGPRHDRAVPRMPAAGRRISPAAARRVA